MPQQVISGCLSRPERRHPRNRPLGPSLLANAAMAKDRGGLSSPSQSAGVSTPVQRDLEFALSRNLSVGGLLRLARLPLRFGIQSLFFGCQLFDRRLWRHCATFGKHEAHVNTTSHPGLSPINPRKTGGKGAPLRLGMALSFRYYFVPLGGNCLNILSIALRTCFSSPF
jgi:hypothetical protein